MDESSDDGERRDDEHDLSEDVSAGVDTTDEDDEVNHGNTGSDVHAGEDYEQPQAMPEEAEQRSPIKGREKSDFLEPATFEGSLSDAALLLVFGVVAVGASVYLGGALTVERAVTALTAPLSSLSVQSVLFQYGAFLFVSAVVTPVSTYVLLTADVELQKPKLEVVQEVLPVPFVVYGVVVGALEEVVFRLLPLVIATAVFGNGMTVVFGALIIGTIPWVFAHTSGQYPNTAVFGVFFILLWAGGYGVAAIAIHVIHNFTAITLQSVFSAAFSD